MLDVGDEQNQGRKTNLFNIETNSDHSKCCSYSIESYSDISGSYTSSQKSESQTQSKTSNSNQVMNRIYLNRVPDTATNMRHKKVHFAISESENRKSKQKCCRFISIDEGFPLIILLLLVDLVYTLLLGIN